MGWRRRRALDLLRGFLLLVSFGCGGGSSSLQTTPSPPPPPPQPDFSIGFSVNSINLQQGSTSPAVNLSVTSLNGFTGSVQVTLTGLPADVISNPVSPFSVAVGSSTPVLFPAATNALTGNSTIIATGTNGSLSHPANLGITIQTGAVANLPRTAYARTDSIPAMDDASGEPHHRHIAYDPAHQLVFVANRAMNRVEVFSSTTATRVTQISVPGASSADLSTDDTTVWIGTVTEQVAAIDTTSLQVKARYEIAGLQPLPNTLFDRPEELLALSNGNVMMRLRQSQTGEALLALWAPSSNTLSNLTATHLKNCWRNRHRATDPKRGRRRAVPWPGLDLSLSPRMHHPANAHRNAWRSRHRHHLACRFRHRLERRFNICRPRISTPNPPSINSSFTTSPGNGFI
jgi:hypothetical protein